MTATSEKVTSLNDLLVGVENSLLKRKIDRQDVTIDGALDVINKASEAGAIEVGDCEGCDDEPASSETQDGAVVDQEPDTDQETGDSEEDKE
jgi:hypothetical protein